jgi:hypothetical protein
MESDQRVIIRFLLREEVSADDIQRRLQAQFGDDTYKMRTFQGWCTQVRQGREDLNDAPRPGRPVIDHLDTKILACLDKAPFQSARSLAQELGVSLSTVLTRLHDVLGMKCYHLRWIPHNLTDELRAIRLKKCLELLPILESMKLRDFRCFVTGDESWFYLDYYPKTQWCISRDDVEPKARQTIGSKEFISDCDLGDPGFPRGRSTDHGGGIRFEILHIRRSQIRFSNGTAMTACRNRRTALTWHRQTSGYSAT